MTSMVSRPRHDWEYWYILFSLLFLTNALIPLLYDLSGGARGESYTDSNPLKLFLSILIYFISGVLVLRSPGNALRLLRQNPFVIVLLLLPLASTLWSVDPGTTVRRAAAYTLTGVFCIYLAGRLSPEQLLKRLMFVLLVGGIASLFYAILLPRYGIHQDAVNPGAWKGVYGHKNDLGRISAIALVVSYFVQPSNRTERIYRVLTIGIFLVLLLLSQSRTNWLIMIGVAGLVPLIRVLRTRTFALSLRVFIVLSFGISFVFLAAIGADELLSAVGRTETFSGRETIWRAVIAIVNEHYPILGAGYGAFFTDSGGVGELQPYLIYFTGVPNHAHNGYLNVWADLGGVGLFMLIAFIVISSVQLMRRIVSEPNRAAWPAFGALMFVFLLNNVSESVAFKHSDIAWAMVLIASFYATLCPRHVLRHQVKVGPQNIRYAGVSFKPTLAMKQAMVRPIPRNTG